MPEAEVIVAGLTRVARSATGFAIAWHVVVALTVSWVALGPRPTSRNAAVFCVLPLISVSAFALVFSSPFNAAVFALAAVGSLVLALRLPKEPVEFASGLTRACGATLVCFAWVYPHFLEDRNPVAYLYAAPLGLVPCPSLSLVIGASILVRSFGSRTWSLLLGALGLFYGAFGVVRLGVTLDLALAAGALVLLFVGCRPQLRPARVESGGGRAM